MTKAKIQKATCTRSVPACLSPTGKEIQVGTEVEYTKLYWRNGEGHLKLASGGSVPDIFFDL